ncbi:kinase-like domain-containing protein [Multifurca ochricompacta]|uniref:non-specific serine/threonine protein kinase n=1 Tax=Multifurca ochricompacta TaxID=376703 RepID=A0AAD4MG21_9AGAM|nr:kinase-like domain-containing protein [Multifurca ochricompacta]
MSPKDEESPADYNYGGYLQVKVGDSFKDGRYLIIRKLGWGHFSTVWLVKDSLEQCHSALKIVKSAGRYSETARDEIKLLRQIANASPSHPGRAHIVNFLDSFTHTISPTIHICITFEPLGENLLSLIEKNRRKGVAPCVVKSVTKQILLGLQYLHEECDFVHTDIKPENIMMCIPDIESHIATQLSSSPPPQTHKLPIPPNPRSRRVSALTSHALSVSSRSVHIVESQPLSTPPDHHRLHSRLGYTDSLLRPGSSVSTPATSLGSAMSKLKLTSPERSTRTPLKNAVLHIEARKGSPTRVFSAGPSLLTQTAPSDLHRIASPHTGSPSSSPSADPSSESYLSQIPSSPPSSDSLLPPVHPILIKIADLGNATPSKRHYTEDIQTRQYRSPEAIIGRNDWGCKVDVWSVACVVFELLTAEYLFEPQSQGQVFSKDDDHLAQIIELLGDLPSSVKQGGRYSRELFDHTGALRYIKHLKPWPLNRVMREKYLFEPIEADALCSFLEPMLALDMCQRASAGEMVNHPWLDVDWKEDATVLESVVW